MSLNFEYCSGVIGINNTAYVDVICHFIDIKNQLRTLLLAVRHIRGDHGGKNQARSILPILEEYSLKEKLGYFITDNASSNDTCVTEIIETLQPDLDAHGRRLRCMGHIINLITKAFLFGNKSETFEVYIAVAEGINDLEGSMKLWRKQGAVGKLHNLIRFICASPNAKNYSWIWQKQYPVPKITQTRKRKTSMLLMITRLDGIQRIL